MPMRAVSREGAAASETPSKRSGCPTTRIVSSSPTTTNRSRCSTGTPRYTCWTSTCASPTDVVVELREPRLDLGERTCNALGLARAHRLELVVGEIGSAFGARCLVERLLRVRITIA